MPTIDELRMIEARALASRVFALTRRDEDLDEHIGVVKRAVRTGNLVVLRSLLEKLGGQTHEEV